MACFSTKDGAEIPIPCLSEHITTTFPLHLPISTVQTTDAAGKEPPVGSNESQTSDLPGNAIETKTQQTAAPQTTELVASTRITSRPADPSATQAPTLQSATASRKSDGVSKGAAAGIAIGAAIIGAAIAFIVAFLLFKRSKRSRPHSGTGYESNPELMSLAKAAPMSHVREMSQTHLPPPIVAAAVAPPRREVAISDTDHSDFLVGVLPPPADDLTVRQRVSSLFDQIQVHVENFYRDVHASITPSMETGLAKFGVGAGGVTEMLQNSSRPTVVLKHALMAYVLSITSPAGGKDIALFPKDVAGIKSGEEFKGDHDLSVAYSLYKRLAVYLHSFNSSPANLKADILEAAEHFSLTFFPWANPRYGDQEQDENLVQIITAALELNLWLYGQPATYEFLWEGVGRRGIVVAPGVTKISNENSKQPRLLLEPIVVPT